MVDVEFSVSSFQIESEVKEFPDYFKVKRAVERIEKANDVEAEKIRLLYEEAQQIFEEIKPLTESNKINALRWNDKTYVPHLMSEEELIKQTESMIARYHKSSAMRNLAYWALHYKKAYYHSKVYEPFFKACMDLLRKVLNDLHLKELYSARQEQESLLSTIKSQEAQYRELQDECKALEAQNTSLKHNLQKLLAHQEAGKIYMHTYNDQIKDPDFFKIVTYLLIVESADLKDLLKKVDVRPMAKLTQTLQAHKKYFNVQDNIVTLNFELPEIVKEYEKQEAIVEELAVGNKTILSKIGDRIKGLVKTK